MKMDAFDVMTSTVVTVGPETPLRKIARLLLEHSISAVPVVDEAGTVIGMVSEGDLLRHNDEDRRARRDWWLDLLAQGESLSPQFLATLRTPNRTAREIMSAPVVTVSEHTDVAEIGKLLATHRIKRVPVVRDGRIAGIVSRADLVRALAMQEPASGPPRTGGLFSWRSHHENNKAHADAKEQHLETAPAAKEETFTAPGFRSLVGAALEKKAAELEAARRTEAGQRATMMKQAIDHHITDDHWRGLLYQAQHAAEHGETELLVLRFPANLCSDGGRAINVPEPDWPSTLRGEAAETYLRFENELKPLGFHLIARVMDFPGGFIGDIGLFLHWGGTV
ncbi:MAG: CBS domain-containing protein [Rhodomicrobium sp.]